MLTSAAAIIDSISSVESLGPLLGLKAEMLGLINFHKIRDDHDMKSNRSLFVKAIKDRVLDEAERKLFVILWNTTNKEERESHPEYKIYAALRVRVLKIFIILKKSCFPRQ
jgi:hypothetical protein